MRETVFFRLLKEKEKAQALLAAITAEIQGTHNEWTHRVHQEAFRVMPGSAFAYWTSDDMRQKFRGLRVFEGNAGAAKQGLVTSNDFRFLRCSWEVSGQRIGFSGNDTLTARSWVAFPNGGEFSPHYADIPLLVNWGNRGAEIKLFERSVIRNEEFYFLPGLTWPLRASSFSPQVRPSGSLFSIRSYSILAEAENQLPYLLGLTCSKVFDFIFKMLLGRYGFPEFIVGVLKVLPIPNPDPQSRTILGSLALTT